MNLRSLKYFLISFIAVASLVFAASSLYFFRWLHTEIDIPDDYRIYAVEEGDSLHKLSARLRQQGLLRWSKVWVAYAKYRGATQINRGEFKLAEKESPVSLLEKFQSSEVVQYSLTLIEGTTIAEAVNNFKNAEKLSRTIESPFFPDSSQVSGVDDAHLEGMFYADTYFYSAGETDVSILVRAHKKLKQVLAEEWQHRAANLPYTSPYEALIMASIIEKETGAPHERAEIAGVFIRRLEQGMRLQTDPTVIYGLTREWDGNITRKDLKTAHPYNTYVIKGLPPTPIALVGRAAIHAALHPAEGTALYFVAKGDGTHYFSDTLEEHNQAVKRYQLQRKENYRSNYQAN